MLNYISEIVRRNNTARMPLMTINSVCLSTCVDAADIASDNNFAYVLYSNIYVSRVKVSKTINMSKVSYAETTVGVGNIKLLKKKQVVSATLAKCWNIDPKKALKTVKQKTQRNLRSTLYPSLS